MPLSLIPSSAGQLKRAVLPGRAKPTCSQMIAKVDRELQWKPISAGHSSAP